jgi:hypothetical protein
VTGYDEKLGFMLSHSWADSANFHLTDRLISSIKENIRYRQAFGFKGGDVAGMTSGGKSTIQMCREIAAILFPDVDAKIIHDKLGDSINNRIHAYVYPCVLVIKSEPQCIISQ